MATLIEAHRSLSRTFGFSLRPWAAFALHQPRLLFNALAGALDPVFFPGFDRAPLDRPVFVVGNPRSGTTLMHRFLARTEPLAGFDIWEMLFPPIVARTLLGPLVRRLAPRLPPPPSAAEIHETGLLMADTDDAYLLLNHLDGPLYWVAVTGWEPDFVAQLADEARVRARTERYFDVLERVWRRNLRYRRKPRALVKSSVATGAIPTLLRRHPSARLVYLLRNPIEVIPSTLSLAEHVWVKNVRAIREPTPAQLATYYENLYRASCRLYLDFHHQRTSGLIPDANLHVVDYRRMMKDFEGVMRETLAFAELPVDPRLIAELAPKQRTHKSAHRYTLERYGLSEARVRRDLAPIFEAYGLG